MIDSKIDDIANSKSKDSGEQSRFNIGYQFLLDNSVAMHFHISSSAQTFKVIEPCSADKVLLNIQNLFLSKLP